MNPVSLQAHLRKIGVPPQRGRASAIRQLVLQAPAPVIAKALGYHDKTATAWSPRLEEPGAGMPRVTTGADPSEHDPECRRKVQSPDG